MAWTPSLSNPPVRTTSPGTCFTALLQLLHHCHLHPHTTTNITIIYTFYIFHYRGPWFNSVDIVAAPHFCHHLYTHTTANFIAGYAPHSVLWCHHGSSSTTNDVICHCCHLHHFISIVAIYAPCIWLHYHHVPHDSYFSIIYAVLFHNSDYPLHICRFCYCSAITTSIIIKAPPISSSSTFYYVILSIIIPRIMSPFYHTSTKVDWNTH